MEPNTELLSHENPRAFISQGVLSARMLQLGGGNIWNWYTSEGTLGYFKSGEIELGTALLTDKEDQDKRKTQATLFGTCNGSLVNLVVAESNPDYLQASFNMVKALNELNPIELAKWIQGNNPFAPIIYTHAIEFSGIQRKISFRPFNLQLPRGLNEEQLAAQIQAQELSQIFQLGRHGNPTYEFVNLKDMVGYGLGSLTSAGSNWKENMYNVYQKLTVGFNPYYFANEPIEFIKIDGKYWALNHRKKATILKTLGVEKIPAVVYPAR